MSFRDDYFRRILERIEQTVEERADQSERGRTPDSLDRVDAELVEHYRERPDALRTTIDEAALELEGGAAGAEDMFSLKTGLLLDLRRSGLSESTVLFLARSLLVGVERVLERRSHLPALPNLLADILRQQRIARALSPLEVAEAWRVLFEVEAERENFANAEDALFHAIELADDPEALIRRGLDFYEDLTSRSDHRLRRGGLDADEVDRARWELVERLDDLL
jgi:hypothetical protein